MLIMPRRRSFSGRSTRRLSTGSAEAVLSGAVETSSDESEGKLQQASITGSEDNDKASGDEFEIIARLAAEGGMGLKALGSSFRSFSSSSFQKMFDESSLTEDDLASIDESDPHSEILFGDVDNERNKQLRYISCASTNITIGGDADGVSNDDSNSGLDKELWKETNEDLDPTHHCSVLRVFRRPDENDGKLKGAESKEVQKDNYVTKRRAVFGLTAALVTLACIGVLALLTMKNNTINIPKKSQRNSIDSSTSGRETSLPESTNHVSMPSPPPNLSQTCSVESISTNVGYNACEEFCVGIECCLFELHHPLSCRKGNTAACDEYISICTVLDVTITSTTISYESEESTDRDEN